MGILSDETKYLLNLLKSENDNTSSIMPYTHGYTAPRSRLPLTPPEVRGTGYSQGSYYGAIGQSVWHQTAQEASYAHMRRSMQHDIPPISAPVPDYRTHEYYPQQLPILPPIRTHDLDYPPRSVQELMNQSVEEPNGEKVPGGVASKLTYKLEHMIDFICEMSQGMYHSYHEHCRVLPAGIQQALRRAPVNIDPEYRKYVSQLLTSTRLPISTLMLALHYMAKRIELLQGLAQYPHLEANLDQMLTTSLMLASKFLDDNTFQNRSWAEVSRVPVRELNKHELAWLRDWGWHLQFDVEHEFKLWVIEYYGWLSHGTQIRSMQSSLESLKLSQPEAPTPQSARYPLTPLYTPPSYYESSFGQPRQRPDPWTCGMPKDLSPPSAGPSYPSTPGQWPKNPPPGFSQHSLTYSSRPHPPPGIVPSNQSPHYANNYDQYNTWCAPVPQNYHDNSRASVYQLGYSDPRAGIQRPGYYGSEYGRYGTYHT